MFERRLKVLLSLPVLAATVILARLFQLQVIQGGEYSRKADAALVSPRQYLPPLRGRIVDRYGRVLVSDEPAHDVVVHYGALSMDAAYLRLLADRIRRKEPAWKRTAETDLVAEATRRIGRMWLTLEHASGIPLAELRGRRDAICDSIEGLRRHLWKARQRGGDQEPIDKLRLREEDLFHAIVRDVTPESRTRIELELGAMPSVRIEPSVRRVWHAGADALCHVLGQLGTISPQSIDDDPYRDDPLRAYRADDPAGISGVERLAENMLRGRRGFEESFLDGTPKSRVPPLDGLDVQLTIDVDLQSDVAAILEETVARQPASTGASCVVMDVATREVLALVSVPTFDRAGLRREYAALRDDARRSPLRFRAVAEEYQPGSILKPAALLAAFSNRLVRPDDRVFCGGALSPESNAWHCWTHWRNMPGHGDMIGEEALQHSCNVYFYTLGQRVGAGRLTDFYRRFLLTGSPGGISAADDRRPTDQGTGLAEERTGLIPTLDWLQHHRRRGFNVADARNYAIGQGELQITPLQAANLFATLADGRARAPTIVANDGRRRAAMEFRDLPVSAWEYVRRGLFRCVNEEGGTAFKFARMEELPICGKTGSAECVPRVVERDFVFESPDPSGPRVSAIAATIEQARELLNLPASARCVSRKIVKTWPPPDAQTGDVPTHAWFAGFAPYKHPRIAMALVVEFGGGGGATAGIAAKQVFTSLLKGPRGYLISEGEPGLAQANEPRRLQDADP